MGNLDEFNTLDDVILEIARDVKPLYYVSPSNEAEQMERFFNGEVSEPVFEYKDAEYDTSGVEARLNALDLPDHRLSELYEKKIRQTFAENGIIRNRGDKDIVRELSIGLNGKPSEGLVEHAESLLSTLPNSVSPKTVDAGTIRYALQQGLQEAGLEDWSVELADKRLTTIYAPEKRMTVCRDRSFADNDPERLKVHEVGVHALRAANGYEQPLKIFALGVPGYLPTEEGLASYFEEISGNSSDETMRDYAARVIAVDSVCNDMGFRETFDRLKDHELDDEKAWQLALRAHRGGGYVKDHVYLQGFTEVKGFAEDGGSLYPLYVGKVGLEDLSLVGELLEDGTLREPRYLPDILRRG